MTTDPDGPADVAHDFERLLITIDITEQGDITCWTVSHMDGGLVEDWRSVGDFNMATHSHTWEVNAETWAAIRDILRYLTEEDWTPGQIM